MLELSHRAGSSFANSLQTELSYGGDTLNTAVYLARLGIDVDYVTALGDDCMSQWMIEQWQREGVGCSLIPCRESRVPGMYMIRTDSQGERSFLYWRSNSPASELFDDAAEAATLFASLKSYDWIYLSGITLAIYSEEAIDSLLDFLEGYRASGGKVIYDGNCRPQLWSDIAFAKQTYERIYRLTDIALPTLGDESILFGEETPEQSLLRFRSYGIAEVTLKMGAEGAIVTADAGDKIVKATTVNVIDTTAAGDSFNAGYLAARFNGLDVEKAALTGHSLASTVIQYRGAVIPNEMMPAISFG
jgi:2-dehydro-3-deoxygluconokinase